MVPRLLQMFAFAMPFLAILYHTDMFGYYSVVDLTQRVFHKHSSLTSLFGQEKIDDKVLFKNKIFAVEVLLTELLVIFITVTILNKFNQYRTKDSIRKLVDVGKKAIKESEEIIDKWKLQQGPSNTHTDDEVQDATPSILEVPILHMAILDAFGNTRTQHERGDSGSTFNVTDSALLFSSTFLEDDLNDSNPETEDPIDERQAEANSRFLWDVIKEDFNLNE